MKKLSALAAMLMMVAAVFTSCGDEEPEFQSGLAGTWTGSHQVNVAFSGTTYLFAMESTYFVADNEDGTINVIVPAYEIEVTLGQRTMNMEIGTYAVTGLTYNAAKGGYYKEYADGQLTIPFNMGQGTKNYLFVNGEDDVTYILVKKTGTGIKVENSYRMENAPVTVKNHFTGKK